MRALVFLLALSLTACGFQLRGSYTLPWDTLHIGLNENTPMYQQIKRGVEASTKTRIVPTAKEADASLVVVSDTQSKSILSLTAQGRVRELQLSRSFTYRIVDAHGKELAPTRPIVLLREMSFDDQQVLAKEAEEGMIYQEMQNDLVQQILRRLAAGDRAQRK